MMTALAETEEPAPLADIIRSKLERAILDGEYLPGDRLNELALAERFGTSRGPIRDAMRSLEHARLVKIVPNRGGVVRTVDLAEALELYDVRAGLARTAGRLLANRASTAQLQTLDDLYRQMSGAVAAGDTALFNTANHAFHDHILAFAGNGRLQEIDVNIRNEMQLYIRQGVMGDAQLRASNSEHERILAALKAGDADTAGREFEQHICNGKQRMLENLRATPARRPA
jgi:DNA-binding GntR family transcriptional regulator